jgi:resuscitation-promoting factor RpfA
VRPEAGKKDPSLHKTQLSVHHQRDLLDELAPEPSAPTLLSREHAQPSSGAAMPSVTQPTFPAPYVSPRAHEPASGDHAAAPLPAEPPTGSDRRSRELPVAEQIERDIMSEFNKLPDEPAGPGPIEPLEVIARPAPLWRRIGALLVDTALASGVAFGVGKAVFLAARLPGTPAGMSGLDGLSLKVHDSPRALIAVVALTLLLLLGCSVLFAVRLSGRTPGRLLFGLRLVDRRGQPPGTARAVARAVLSLLSAALCFAGFWLLLFDRRGQALHDKLVSTFVVRLTPSGT